MLLGNLSVMTLVAVFFKGAQATNCAAPSSSSVTFNTGKAASPECAHACKHTKCKNTHTASHQHRQALSVHSKNPRCSPKMTCDVKSIQTNAMTSNG